MSEADVDLVILFSPFYCHVAITYSNICRFVHRPQKRKKKKHQEQMRAQVIFPYNVGERLADLVGAVAAMATTDVNRTA